MTGLLLDVNVVIALIDPLHVDHDRAHHWFAGLGPTPWRTCPIVENGAIRIVSHPNYPNRQPVSAVLSSLASLAALPGHRFITDSVSLLDGTIRTERLISSAQVTDTYLLHLARTHEARLATFDTRIVTSAVSGGEGALEVIR